MTTRRTTIASVALIAAVIGVAGCGGASTHQADPHTVGAPVTTVDPPTTSTPPTTAVAPTTSLAPTTTTTVLGPSGPAASFPAAQPTPPSLAGAYLVGTTVDLVTVLKTLATYRDWVWSHPNPALVANYDLPKGNGYASEVKDITQFQQEGLHADPTPSKITFVRVTLQPVPQAVIAGKVAQINGYQWFRGGAVTDVYNLQAVPMLTANGQPSSQQFNPTTLGDVAYSATLVQGPDGQFRFEDSNQLNPPGGVAALERQP